MNDPRPPRLPGWLLASLLRSRELEYVMGDLVEEYALRARASSAWSSAHWYTMQVCRSIAPLLWASTSRGGWVGTMGVALAAYVTAGLVEAVATALLQMVLVPDSAIFEFGSVAIGLGTIAASGYAAARIKQSSSVAMAAIVLAAVVVLMITATGSAPLWYGLVFLVGGPIAAVGGGVVALRGNGGDGGSGVGLTRG